MAFYSYLSTKIIIAFITKSYQDLFGVRSYINAKYKVGMDKARLILDVDMSEITDTISYEEDNPLMNSTYILYYEVAR